MAQFLLVTYIMDRLVKIKRIAYVLIDNQACKEQHLIL